MIQEIYDDSGNLIDTVEIQIPTDGPIISKVEKLLQLTVSDLQTLASSQALSPSYLYKITDVPDWDIYVTASNSYLIDPLGFGVHQATSITAEIVYYLSTNTLARVYDYTNDNWVAGSTNIANFPWGNSAFSANFIEGGGSITIDPAAIGTITSFRENSIKGLSAITIDSGCQIVTLTNNTFHDSNVDFLNVDCNNIQNNSFLNGDATFKNFTLSSIVNNVFKDVSYFYLDTVTVANFSRNVFENCSIDNGGAIVATSFDDNRIINSSINFIDGNLIDISKNEITDSTINITASAGTANFSANTINESTFDLTNDSGLQTCELFGVIGNLGTTLDTGINYVNCTYKANERSDFYADYDFSSATYYDAAIDELKVQAQHKNIIGTFLVTNNVSGDKITEISNAPTKHKFKVKIGVGGDELHIDTTGHITFSSNLNVTVPIKLDVTYNLQEYVEFDYRPTPIGADNGTGYITVIDTVLYGTLSIPQYQGQLTLTTTGTSGPATLVSNTLNIPQYAGGGGGVSASTAIAYSIALG